MNKKFCFILFFLILLFPLRMNGSDSADRALMSRFDVLESLVRGNAESLPPDMVVYRYRDDSLRSWINSFPVLNDESEYSPLRLISDEAKIYDLGGRKYLAKAVESVDSSGVSTRMVYGLEVPGKGESVTGAKFHPESLGVFPVINAVILLLALLLALQRRRVRPPLWLSVILSLALAVYSFWSLRYLSYNSEVCLQLYRLADISLESGLAYLSFSLVLMCIPLLLKLSGRNPLKKSAKVALSVFFGIFLVGVTGYYGNESEPELLRAWAGKLSVQRNDSLETVLRTAEREMLSDRELSAMVGDGMPSYQISSYLEENYFSSIAGKFDISALGIRDPEGNPGLDKLIEESFRDADPIGRGSAYHFSNPGPGRLRYSAVLPCDAGGGPGILLMRIESGTDKESRLIPSSYSYAKYKDGALQFFRGSYPYPTKIHDRLHNLLYVDKAGMIEQDGYLHFPTIANGDEVVIISRPGIRPLYYVVAVAFISLLFLLLFSLGKSLFGRRVKRERSEYFRNRMAYLMMSSLTLMLVVMMVVSIFFVFRRNNLNMYSMMADKINSIRAMVDNRFADIPLGGRNALSGEAVSALKDVKDMSGTDISLYGVNGKILMSTLPEGLGKNAMKIRMDSKAFDRIIRQNKRYFLQKETLYGEKYYGMYAPVFGPDGTLKAVICAPYAYDSLDFRLDAVMHGVGIMIVFLILLLLMRLLSVTVLDRMFSPLSAMSAKMNRANLGALEHIEYDRDDEIASLVTAYNRMVDALSESSLKLAQAERDKAWTGMARQVAHEIKNPLTPMKLQLQRLIRLKQKGDASWQDKFDEVSGIVLDHIDILSDTANEFSTIAKLTTQERTLIDLGELIPEEVTMFDNREDAKFEYMGLDSATVNGPRPQIARVVVNLLTNALQAVEGKPDARVLVSLRKSVKDGYYDIVVEDNGPGVSEENIDKLFSPNFTTKSGGSGLGLAISRSILESCGATISYGKSFVLGGACFTICYPMAEKSDPDN